MYLDVCVGGSIKRGHGMVSCPAYKDLGNYRFILTSKRLNRLKNQQLFLDPQERGGHTANYCPLDGRDRQANTEN